MHYYEDPPKIPSSAERAALQRPASYKMQPPDLPKAPEPAGYPESLELSASKRAKYAKAYNPLTEGGQLQMDSAGTGVVGMKYVMQRLSALEDEIRAAGQWRKHFAEEDRGRKGVLESSFKVVNEQTGQLVNDLINRVATLDEALKKEEMRVGLLMEKVVCCFDE